MCKKLLSLYCPVALAWLGFLKMNEMEGVLNQLLFMNRIPDWAKFVCVDSKRCVWAFKDEPVFNNEVWVKQKGSDCMKIGEMRYFSGDESSIIPVPVKKEMLNGK